MLKHQVPKPEDITITLETRDNIRLLVGSTDKHQASVRIPLHDFHKIEAGDKELAAVYVGEIMKKFVSGQVTHIPQIIL